MVCAVIASRARFSNCRGGGSVTEGHQRIAERSPEP